MVTAHRVAAFLVVGICVVAAVAAFLAYRRSRGAGRVVAQLLALAQTVLVAEVGIGLILLGDDRRVENRMHYVYGTLALLSTLSPWFYAPAEPRRRLVWFGGATLLAAVLAVRAYMTA
jgi:hypothetical protein